MTSTTHRNDPDRKLDELRRGIPPQGRLKILFIEGAGRSGSTVLDNVLGQLDDFVSVGELRWIWDRNLIRDQVCGCGRPFSSCSLWTDVLVRAFGGNGDQPGIDPAWVIRKRVAALRFRHVPASMAARGESVVRESASEYLAVLSRLYTAIAEVTGARVIVDSSKDPTHGYLLRLLPDVDVCTVRLVRDPRAVAYSWRCAKPDQVRPGETTPMAQFSPLQTSYGWILWNLLSEGYARRGGGSSLRLRYEDFVAAPQQSVRQILSLVDEHPARLPFVSSHTMRLSPNHTVGGNPSRFRTGAIKLQPDEVWRRRLPRRHQVLVTAACWPLMRAYGYRSVR